MKKINFLVFPLFKNVAKTEVEFHDIRQSMSDLIYKFGDGITGHALCHKIYESKGEIELEQHEAEYLTRFAEKHCTPAVIDSIRTNLLDV